MSQYVLQIRILAASTNPRCAAECARHGLRPRLWLAPKTDELLALDKADWNKSTPPEGQEFFGTWGEFVSFSHYKLPTLLALSWPDLPAFLAHALRLQVDAGDLNFSLFAEKGSCQFLHASLVPMLLGQIVVDSREALLKLGYL